MEPILTGEGTGKLPWTLVWIDSCQAHLVRWDGSLVVTSHLESEVPARHRSTGHVRHVAPALRHAGPPRSAGETHRLEHLRRFIGVVAGQLPTGDELAIYGPGTVAEHLTALVREEDRRHRRPRMVAHRRSAGMTPAQLAAEVRRLAGDEPPRRTVGAYRWSGEQPLTSAGGPRPPRRVVRKPPPMLPRDEA
jgi:hypothetical protein